MTPIRAYEASFKKKMGLSTQTCGQFLCVTIIDYLIVVLIELPTLIVTVIALTLSKEYFFLVALCLTSVVLLTQLCLIPYCTMCEQRVKTLPAG